MSIWSAEQAEIQSRRSRLLARSGGLRERLAEEAQALERPLALADRARGALEWLAAHPQWLIAAVAVPIVLRPRRALAWALKLWGGWRLWRNVRGLLSR
jgi:hypothetical protein